MFADIPFLDELSEATRVAGFSKNKYDIYQSDMKSERDILMMMQDQKEQGRAEGRVEGRAEGIPIGELKKAKEIVLNLIAVQRDMSVEQLASIAGVSVDHIKEWIEEK